MVEFNNLKTTNRIVTLALTALATIISAGLLTTVIFRTLTEKFCISKNLKPDSKQESTVKKIHSYQNNNDQNSNRSTFKREKKNESKPYENPFNSRQELIEEVPAQATNLKLQFEAEPIFVVPNPQLNLRRELIEEVPAQATNLKLQPEQGIAIGNLEPEVPLIPNEEIMPEVKLLTVDDKKLFCEELEKDNPSIEILEEYLKDFPSLKEELISKKLNFTKKTDLTFLKFLIEEIKLEFTYYELSRFIKNGWIEGLRYLAENMPKKLFYSSLQESLLFVEAEKQGLPAEIVDLFKPEASSSAWIFVMIAEKTPTDLDFLTRIANGYPNFQIDQRKFEDLLVKQILPFDNGKLKNTNLPLLKILVENCGCQVHSRHLNRIKNDLSNTNIREIFKYLIEKGAHRDVQDYAHIEGVYYLAKQNNLDTETLAALRHPENDLKFAKQQFFKALTGTSFFVRGSGAPTVFTFESKTIKYWLDEIISIDNSKDKLEEEIQVFLDKQTSKRREDILVELDKLDIKLDNQSEDVE